MSHVVVVTNWAQTQQHQYTDITQLWLLLLCYYCHSELISQRRDLHQTWCKSTVGWFVCLNVRWRITISRYDTQDDYSLVIYLCIIWYMSLVPWPKSGLIQEPEGFLCVCQNWSICGRRIQQSFCIWARFRSREQVYTGQDGNKHVAQVWAGFV